MLSTIGLFEILVIAAVAFVAYRLWQKANRKVTTEVAILGALVIYLIYAGYVNDPDTSFAE